jgi:magnesium chelatase subunit I
MLPTRAVLERIDKVPGLRKRAEEFARSVTPDLTDADARDAATAAAAEFILEGLHVHNKLNKSAKSGGRTAYKR